MGAALHLGLTPAGMVGKPRDLQNAANHPDPSPSDREREAFVAGSQAWLDTNPDEQARAKFAALEHASSEARKENYKFSALVYKYRMHDPERKKQEERDRNVALIMQELEYRKVTLAREIEELSRDIENPDVPFDMNRAPAMHQDMARIEDQLKLMDSPSVPVVPDEAVNAGDQSRLTPEG